MKDRARVDYDPISVKTLMVRNRLMSSKIVVMNLESAKRHKTFIKRLEDLV